MQPAPLIPDAAIPHQLTQMRAGYIIATHYPNNYTTNMCTCAPRKSSTKEPVNFAAWSKVVISRFFKALVGI